MGRRRGKRVDGHVVAFDAPQSELDVYELAGKMAIVPENLWFSKIDLRTIVGAFARDNAYSVYDVSPMFRSSHDPEKLDTAITMVSERSIKKTDTIHLAIMDEFSVEAMVIVDVLLQLRDLRDGLTDAVCVGKHILHAICIFNGYTIKLHNVKDALVVRAVLSQMERDAECVICLELLESLHTVLPYRCGHPVCKNCSVRFHMTACPKCRETHAWKCGNSIRIEAYAKKAVIEKGDAPVRFI